MEDFGDTLGIGLGSSKAPTNQFSTMAGVLLTAASVYCLFAVAAAALWGRNLLNLHLAIRLGI